MIIDETLVITFLHLNNIFLIFFRYTCEDKSFQTARAKISSARQQSNLFVSYFDFRNMKRPSLYNYEVERYNSVYYPLLELIVTRMTKVNYKLQV